MNIDIAEGQHIVVLGQTGSGKTFYLKNALLKTVRRVLIIDTEEKEFNDYALAKGNPSHIVRSIPKPKEKNFRWRAVPPVAGQDEYIDELCNELLDAPNAEHSWIVFEEVTDYSDAFTIPDGMRSLVRKARKRKITVACTSQRPAGINKWLYENSQHKFLFYTDPDEQSRMKRLTPVTALALAQIKYGSHDFIYVGPGGQPVLCKHI